jgi:ADP-heptose:LPS heptosyltransferase
MTQGYTYTPKLETSIVDKPSTVNKEKYFIWHIQGGLGKNIAGTSLIKSIKQQYPDRKLIMVTSWPEVYLNNSDVDRVYQLGQAPYFYQDYIENKDVIISKHEPYNQSDHITKKKHLIENWCDLMGLKYTEQLPVILPNYPQGMMLGLWQRSKPIMVIQTGGGPMEGQKYSYSWTRDIPFEVAQEIVKKFSNQYHIIQITRPDGYQLEGVERVDQKMSNMELFSLLVVAKKRVLIDSSLQHAAAALDKKSTVLWVGTSPKVFGYKMHTNIEAKLPKRANQLIGSYTFDFQFENNIHECPYMNINDIFDVNLVLTSI